MTVPAYADVMSWDAHDLESQASLGEAQADNPADDDEMIEPDADPLDTDVEDADLFLGEGDEEEAGEEAAG